MEDRPKESGTTKASTGGGPPPLHTVKPMGLTIFNPMFATVYALAILALFYHHAKTLLCSTTLVSFSINLTLSLSDFVLTFMWINTQTFRMCPVCRKQFPENVEKVMKRSDFPALDVFICTADPYKEPPIGVVNTALSVMAYDYPKEKISVYVSDDGGSALTLFSFMEAAKFSTHWLPFCKKNNILERSPEAYFESNHPCTSESEKIEVMYKSMKAKVENAVEKGEVDDQYITGLDQQQEIFNKWTDNFTRQDHPAVIQVLLDASKDKDTAGNLMPNLIYVSRGKCKALPHHFKAGALNALLRVSSSMTNAPIILTLDCDFCSNDPQTLLRAMCYLCDPAIRSTLAYVQFPQIYRGINKNDIYCGEYKRLFVINTMGMDGVEGPNYVGTGCFFHRRAFFGSPSSLISPEIPELSPDHVVDKPIQSQSVLAQAHQVADCNYENQTDWGSKIGFRYGSLVEDYYTGFRLQCEGWKGIFCNPERPAFLGDVPINLADALNQQKRWSIGLLEVGFSKHSPATFGVRSKGILMGLGYAQLAFWAIWSIPITTYAFLPQLALLNKVSIFPKVSDPWFFLYAFLFLGAYGQDCLDFVLAGGSVQRWWNDQRFWHIRGVTCYLFGSIEFFLKFLGISASGFTVTSKAVDAEQSKRYEQGIFEFGVHSPMFVSLTLAAIINLISFSQGLVEVFRGNNLEGLFVQMFISGFAVVNSWPIYEAIALRNDKGKMPIKTTIMATLLAGAFYAASSFICW
ncbi:PREDICTED: cellulose synthase-like protein G3 [Populus euphratica]|uniref:Cellulose synthase-like protein G3 n=1 Tax=Populus euphratica TaxID=75702 RepID=A0AAJ6U530_POPEU|nr:PREDICTED: cellulose synthase-like protein G3 [Populus euphratica]